MKPLIAAAIALFAAPTFADTRIRTAEHDDFTRIVLDYTDRPDWDLTATEDGFALTTSADITYDLGDVWRRIRRERVADIRQDSPRALHITLSCDCAPRPIEVMNGWLILDIGKGPEFEPLAVSDTTEHRTSPDLAAQLGVEIPSRPVLLPGLLTDLTRDPVVTMPAAMPQDSAPQELRAAREELRAALDLHFEPSDAATAQPHTPSQPTAAPAPADRHIRLRNAAQDPVAAPEGTESGAACPEIADLPLTEWDRAETGPLAAALGYLAQGFGAEAAAILRDAPQSIPSRDLLLEVASVTDGGSGGPLLAKSSRCGPTLGLFAIIAGQASPAVDPAQIAILIGDLPPRLAHYLGNRAAAQLLSRGQEEAARLVRAAVGGAAPDGPRLIDLSLNGDPEGPAPDELARLIADRGPDAAAALETLIDGMRRRGESVPIAILDQAGALAFELGSEDRSRIEALVARVEIAEGRLHRAAGKIDTLSRRDEALARTLDRDLFDAVLAIADDAEFLHTATRLDPRSPADGAQRRALAERLADLGLTDLARSGLADTTDLPGRPDRLLRARLALDEGDPRISESYLAGLTGPDVDLLRTRIAQFAPPEAPTVEVPPPATLPAYAIEGQAALGRARDLRTEIETMLAQ